MYDGYEEKKHSSLKWIILTIVLVVVVILVLLFSKINGDDNNQGSLSFSKKEYSCNVGESFETSIIFPENNKNLKVKSIDSNDVSIVSVENKLDEKCDNCQKIKVLCKSAGNTTITVEDNKDNKVVAQIVVKQNIPIHFEKDNYTCNAGESFETQIFVSDDYSLDSIEAYNTSDESIATMDDQSNTSVNCTNCKIVRVVCKKAGTVTLFASLIDGKSCTANLIVMGGPNPEASPEVKPTKTPTPSPTSSPVATPTTKPTITPVASPVATPTTKPTNTPVVSPVATPTTKPSNTPVASPINRATSSNGATATASVRILNAVTHKGGDVDEKIMFYNTEKSITCRPGETVEKKVMILSGTSDSAISSFTSSDPSIATVDDKIAYQPISKTERWLRISCIKSGYARITVSSKAGTSVGLVVTVK